MTPIYVPARWQTPAHAVAKALEILTEEANERSHRNGAYPRP